MVKLSYWQRACPKSFIRQVKIIPAMKDEGITPEMGAAIREYSQQHQNYFEFHSQFWTTNNARFTLEQESFMKNENIESKDSEEMAKFYRDYMIRYRREFEVYNRMSRRMAFHMLWTEVKWNIFRIRSLLANQIFGIEKKQTGLGVQT